MDYSYILVNSKRKCYAFKKRDKFTVMNKRFAYMCMKYTILLTGSYFHCTASFGTEKEKRMIKWCKHWQW